MEAIKGLCRAHGFSKLLRAGLLFWALPSFLAAQTSTVQTGTTPYAVAVNAVTGQVYIANQGSGTVTILNDASTMTVPVGSQPGAVAVNPQSNKIYVANRGDGTVTVLDGLNPYSTKTISVGAQPNAVVVDPTSDRIFTANSSGSVTVIDGSNNTVLSTLTAGSQPAAITVNTTTHKVYAANSGDNTVTVIDGAAMTVLSTVSVGASPVALVADPVANRIYVANQSGNSVTVLDGSTDAVVSTIAVGTSPSALAVDSVSGVTYVTNTGSNNVTAISSSGSTTQIAVGSAPNALAPNIFNDNIFVTNGASNDVTIINGADYSTRTTPVGSQPKAVAVNPINNHAYVANAGSNNAMVLNGAGATVGTIQTNQQGPSQAILDPVNHKVWVSNTQAGTISIIDPTTDTVTATLTGLSNPFGLTLDASTNKVYVVSQNGVVVYNASTDAKITTITVNPSISSGLDVLNAVTHRLYVTNQYATQKSVTVINTETNTVESQFDANGPEAIALNPVTNKVYIGEANGSDDVLVLQGGVDGTPASVATHVNVGAVNTGNPIGIAVNKKTNRIYVGGSNPTAAVIDGSTDTIVATLNLGGSNYATLLVNEATNQVIAANKGQNAISVINASGGDPETYTVNPTNLIVAGFSPLAAGVIDPTSNTIYFGQPYGSGVVIVDGNDFTNSYVVNTGQSPSELVLDPATGKVYVANSGTNYVSVINGGSGFQFTPPASSIAGVVDALTVTDPDNPNYFQTTNPKPSFVTTVASADSFPNATSVYYTVDGGDVMTRVPVTSTSGSTTTFNLTIGSQQVGAHTLLVYPAFGNEGGNKSSSLGSGNSPYLGSPAAYPFAILQGTVLGTSLSVTATPNPQTLGGTVTVTARITPESTSNGVYPTGNVAFTDELGNVLGSGALPADASGVVTITTTALTAGPHTITATYTGDTGYTGSTGSTAIVISLPATKILAILGQPQSIVYGSAGFANLAALVTDDNNVVVPGVQVSFAASAGSGLSFTPALMMTDAQGQAQTAVVQTPQAVGNYTATATLATNGATAVFNLAVTPAQISVLVDSATRKYGQPNPAFTYSYAGFKNGDTASVISGAPVLSTTATQTSATGDYNILANVSGLSAANYTFTSVSGTLTITTETVLSIALSISPATVVYGNGSTLTATVTAGATGSVSFYDGATLLGTATVDATGVATLPSGILHVGSHNITASYSGDTNYGPIISDAKTLAVTPAQLSVAADSASRPYGQPNPEFTFSVTGFVNGDTASVVSGAPVLSTVAAQSSAPRTYSIAVDASGMSAADYAFVAVAGMLTVSTATPAVSLSINPATVMYGDPSTLTATVIAGATGTVSFFEGTTLLGTATVNAAGDAVLPISTLSVGTHNITATYSGDANYTTASSAPQALTVTQRTGVGGSAGLTITVNDATRIATDANPPFSYSVTGTLYNGDTYATALSGTPSYSTSAGSEPGSYAIALTGLNSANYTITVVNGTLIVTSVPTTTTLTAGPSSPQYGDPVTLTANVAPVGATGTISFYDGSVLLGSANVSGGAAVLTTSTLTAGTHAITAIYNGDGVYASSTSTPLSVTVAKKTAAGGGPALTVTVGSASRTYGDANPTFSYTVSGTLVNGDTYPTAVTGVPVYSTGATTSSPASPPTFPISVSGLSSANYEVAFVDGTLTIVPASSQTTLTTSAPTAQYGTQITLTATVTTTPANATGTVIFSNGTAVLGTATLSGGTASLITTSLGVGSYTITSTYQGDTNYGTSISGPVSVTITPAPLTVTVQNATRPATQGNPQFSYAVSGTLYNGDTYATAVTGVPVYSTTATPNSVPGNYPVSLTGGLNSANYALTLVPGTLTITQVSSPITLSVSPATVVYGTASTLTANVTVGATGTVSFYDGATLLGTATVNDNGVATLPSGVLNVASHTITAIYNGDVNYESVTSSPKSITVTPASLTVTAVSATRAYGAPNPALTYTITGFVNGETATVVSGTPALSTTAVQTSTPGTYAIQIDVTGLSATNYTFTGIPGTLTVTEAAPAVSLAINPTSVMYGDPSVLTATVIAGATGTVSFYEGTTLLGTSTVDGVGKATLPVSTLDAGTHNITATYNGDADYEKASSTQQTLTVLPRQGGTDLPALVIRVNDITRTTIETNPPFTYSTTGDLVNGDTYATAITGTPVYSTTAGSTPGTYSITLTGLSSTNYTISIRPGTLTVVLAPTTTTLTATPASTQYGNPVTLTASVAPAGASGSISFFDGPTLLGSATVSGGAASITTTMLAAGTHSLTAVYNGDSVYASSQSDVAAVTIAKKTGAGGGAALTVTVENANRVFGTADPEFSYVVSGALVNGDTYASAVTGVPVYSVTDTPVSPAGSTFPISVNGLTSENYTLAFVPGTLTITSASSQTSLITSAGSVRYGNPITLTATVGPPTATGMVIFMEGTTVLGTATVSGGVATLTTELAVGEHTITATYEGDVSHGASASEPVTITVDKGALMVTVQNVSRELGKGNPAFSYTVSGQLATGDTYATAVTGVPVYSTTATVNSPVGMYPITLLGGLASTNYELTFVNGTLAVTDLTSDFSIASPTPPQIIPPGASASYTIVLGSLLSPYNDPVGLTVTGLPQGATYTFTPAMVTPGAAGANSTLTINVPQQQAAVRTGYKPLFLATMLLLPCVAFCRRRRKMPLLAALIALMALGSITGCGVGGYFSQPQQTYTLTVTGTSGILVHSTTVTLTVE